MQPYWYGQGRDMAPAEFGLVAARALEEKIEEIGAENAAAFISKLVSVYQANCRT